MSSADGDGHTLHSYFLQTYLVAVFKEVIASDRDRTEIGYEVKVMSALEEATLAKHAAECTDAPLYSAFALTRIGLSTDDAQQLQTDMWLTGFTRCFREKEDT